MQHKTFYTLVEGDEMFEEGSKDLREQFGYSEHIPVEKVHEEITGPASFLEMMIILARQMAFEMRGFVRDSSARRWFWEMLDNCGLTHFPDSCFYEAGGEWLVDDILEKILSRDYGADGAGGFFPLSRPSEDMRRKSLISQAQSYMLERYWKREVWPLWRNSRENLRS